MALAAMVSVSRSCLLFHASPSSSSSLSSCCKRLLFPTPLPFHPQSLSFSTPPFIHRNIALTPTHPQLQLHQKKTHFPKPFSTSSPPSKEEESSTPRKRKNTTMVNFSVSDSDSESDPENSKPTSMATRREADRFKLPPPYDPFSKKPAFEEPKDPKNLQEVFHNMKNDGLLSSAVKMFDGLSKDGLTHEALELFGEIKDKGNMPDVVAHTAVIEAYAEAGRGKEALKVYMRMLACGVPPNAYTYAVLIKGLAGCGDAKLLGDARKYVVEMMEKGMRPNAGTYAAVFEAFAREGKAKEGKEFLEELRGRGFTPDEKAVREVLRDKRGPVFRSVMNMLFGK